MPSNRIALLAALLWIVTLAAAQGATKIAGIRVVGEPVAIFTPAQKTPAQKTPAQNASSVEIAIDGPVCAWKEADGAVSLQLPWLEAYRLKGPDLLHLTLDPKKIFSCKASAMQIPEDKYNYLPFLMAPYSLDGVNFYTATHTEWYAAVLEGHTWDDGKVGDNGLSVMYNSWVTSVNSFKSTDGGASWQLNTVKGTHTIAKPGYHWTGSPAFASKAYLHAANPTGFQQITRLIKEGDYYYCIGSIYLRDFSKIDPAHGQWKAPYTKRGNVILRTKDFRTPIGWQLWSGGGKWEPTSTNNYATFVPKQGSEVRDAWSPTILYDTKAQAWLFVFCPSNGTRDEPASYPIQNIPLYYMTTKTLANPAWSDYAEIQGTGQLLTDPNKPYRGFWAPYYPSIMDPTSSGYNFEFTSGNPYLFWTSHPDDLKDRPYIYRVQLSIAYDETSTAPSSPRRP